MAKGNLFLGTAAKSVGDVVMYRRDGSQVSRVRVRKIANPKTDAQCAQRAIMAAVVKLYQPFATALERSWQGLSTAKSYAKFLSVNAALLKANPLWYEKGADVIAFPAQLSSGVLDSFVYYDHMETMALDLGVRQSTPTVTTVGQLSALLIEQGAQNGDIITIILKTTDGYTIAPQFEAKDTSAATLAETFPEVRFVVGSKTIDGENHTILAISPKLSTFLCGGIINSRWDGDKWLRSTSFAICNHQFTNSYTGDTAKAKAIASYKGAATDGNPLVYLDGEELENS